MFLVIAGKLCYFNYFPLLKKYWVSVAWNGMHKRLNVNSMSDVNTCIMRSKRQGWIQGGGGAQGVRAPPLVIDDRDTLIEQSVSNSNKAQCLLSSVVYL